MPELGGKLNFESMEKPRLVKLLNSIRNELISTEDARSTVIFLDELLNVDPGGPDCNDYEEEDDA